MLELSDYYKEDFNEYSISYENLCLLFCFS